MVVKLFRVLPLLASVSYHLLQFRIWSEVWEKVLNDVLEMFAKLWSVIVQPRAGVPNVHSLIGGMGDFMKSISKFTVAFLGKCQ